MKTILSREGFDSGYGGRASPIFPDHSIASYPIPDPKDEVQILKDKYCNGHNLAQVAGVFLKSARPSNPFGIGQIQGHI